MTLHRELTVPRTFKSRAAAQEELDALVLHGADKDLTPTWALIRRILRSLDIADDKQYVKYHWKLIHMGSKGLLEMLCNKLGA